MAEEKQDLQKIKKLIELMINNGLVELEIVDGPNKILLKRPQPQEPTITQIPVPVAAQPQPAAEQPAEQIPQTREDKTLIEIKSPIVGTFYSAPSPESEPFVTTGSRVEPDMVICIVEAMKVMNEIKAEISGTIIEILCDHGQAVEYGQPLFKVEPD